MDWKKKKGLLEIIEILKNKIEEEIFFLLDVSN